MGSITFLSKPPVMVCATSWYCRCSTFTRVSLYLYGAGFIALRWEPFWWITLRTIGESVCPISAFPVAGLAQQMFPRISFIVFRIQTGQSTSFWLSWSALLVASLSGCREWWSAPYRYILCPVFGNHACPDRIRTYYRRKLLATLNVRSDPLWFAPFCYGDIPVFDNEPLLPYVLS